MKLNEKQDFAYKQMINNKNIMLSGPAGTGKSYLMRAFYNNYTNSKTIALTSTTGTSAIVLGGTTLHSYLGIGLGVKSVQDLVIKINSKGYLKSKWRKLDVLIIDEVSMMTPTLFDKLEEIARLVRNNNIFFGGIQLILSGDFLQIPCVNTSQFVFESENWNSGIDYTIELTEIVRQRNRTFQNCLNKIRVGNNDDEVKSILNSRIGIKLENKFGIKPTKLFSLNVNVDKINEEELMKSEEEVYEYEMDISCVNQNKLEFYKNNCIAMEKLRLTVGAQVMLLVNMDIEYGLANGSRGIVTGINNDYIPYVRFVNGEERLIDYHVWNIEDKKLECTISQIPLKLAYAQSIHKAQGSTLDYVEIKLSDVFDYGQAYVGLSRCKSLEGLSIIDIDWNKINAHPKAIEFYKNLRSS
jgi:ATP-dependent DNA helicase PIF1